MPVIDDAALRAAALQLVCEAKRVLPRVALGVQAVEHANGAKILVEVEIDQHGPRTVSVLLDTGAPTQSILAEIVQPGEPVRELRRRKRAPPQRRPSGSRSFFTQQS
jgi:hypothetical protein